MLRGTPVLMYHGMAARPPASAAADTKYWVTPVAFRQHLVQIRHGGYHTALLEDLWGTASQTGRVPSMTASVVLTFDDGRATDYDVAFPLLLEAGARAEFFINTAMIGQPGYLSWDQVRHMQRAGMSFQSHGHNHVALVGLSEEQLAVQLELSKRVLTERLVRPVDFLAVPYGFVNQHIVSAARAAGYRAVCTSRRWPAWPGLETVDRVAVYRHTTGRQFNAILQRRPLAYLPGLTKTAIGYVPKRVLLKLRPDRLGFGPLPSRGEGWQ